MKHAAFTLVEVLITLVVIGIVAAVVPLVLRRDNAVGTSTSAQLLEARRQAVRTGSPVGGVSDSVGRFMAFADGFIVTDSAPHARLAAGDSAP